MKRTKLLFNIFSLFCIFLNANGSYSQVISFEFISETTGETALSIVEASNKEYVVAATNNVFKLDSVGNLLWSNNFNFYEGSKVFIIKTVDESFIVANTTLNPLEISLTKLTDNGDIEWENTFEESNPLTINGIIEDSEGDFLLVGTYNIDNSNKISYLIKINDSGVKTWSKSYSFTDRTRGLSVIETFNGDYVMSCLMDNLPSLVRTNNNGDILWSKLYNSPFIAYNFVLPIFQTKDSCFVFISNFESYDQDGNSSIICQFKKVDQFGSTLTQKDLTNKIRLLKSAFQTKAQGYILTGYNYLFYDIPFLEVDSLFKLNLYYKLREGGGNCIIETNNGDILIAGLSKTNYNKKTYVIKLATENSLHINNLDSLIHISPNPCSTTASILLPLTKGKLSINIYTLNGKLIKSIENYDTKLLLLDVSSFSQGIYFLQTIDEEGNNQTAKLIVN